MANLIMKTYQKENNDSSPEKIPVNFYVSRLNDEHTKAHGYCLVFQPIIILN